MIHLKIKPRIGIVHWTHHLVTRVGVKGWCIWIVGQQNFVHRRWEELWINFQATCINRCCHRGVIWYEFCLLRWTISWKEGLQPPCCKCWTVQRDNGFRGFSSEYHSLLHVFMKFLDDREKFGGQTNFWNRHHGRNHHKRLFRSMKT